MRKVGLKQRGLEGRLELRGEDNEEGWSKAERMRRKDGLKQKG